MAQKVIWLSDPIIKYYLFKCKNLHLHVFFILSRFTLIKFYSTTIATKYLYTCISVHITILMNLISNKNIFVECNFKNIIIIAFNVVKKL